MTTAWTLRNALMLPLVILIRLPILLPLYFVAILGNWAECLADEIGPYLPGLERKFKGRRP